MIKLFTHEYWKKHHISHLHSRGYHGIIRDDYSFKSHGFQRMKYRTYPSFVVNNYFHRNRINSIKLRCSLGKKKRRISSRSKYPIRNNHIFKIDNDTRKHYRFFERLKMEGYYD